MKRIKYLLILVAGIVFLGSCEQKDALIDEIESGNNIAGFEAYKLNYGALANGDEYSKMIQVKVSGPNMDNVSSDIVLTVAASPSSTAIVGTHYRIDNPTITLTKSNNYLGNIEMIMVTEGNVPPKEPLPLVLPSDDVYILPINDSTPVNDTLFIFDPVAYAQFQVDSLAVVAKYPQYVIDSTAYTAYRAPVLVLTAESATGAGDVLASGKLANFTLNFTPPNPYAGSYIANVSYFHPSAGVYPDNLSSQNDYAKDLVAVTGNKVETGFAVWPTTDLCWITVNPDNSISYEVDVTWTYDVILGVPGDPSKVSHYDPETGVIYLYYHYFGASGPRIFHEVFTPKN